MTPLECAQELAGFLKEAFKNYGASKAECQAKLEKLEADLQTETDERAREELEATKAVLVANEDEPVNVYAGFLPYTSKKTADKLCPAIVVRPYLIADKEEETTASIAVIVTTFDEDMLFGCYSLFHVLEKIRFDLLTNNPILRKIKIKEGSMETVVPDGQPYPQWLGQVTFDVYLPQPENHRFLNEAVMR